MLDNNYVGDKEQDIKDIADNIAVAVVLSNIAIDYSKKIVEVDIDGKLKEIGKLEATKKPIKYNKNGKLVRKSRKKPKFWSYVTSSDPEIVEYNCPMDMLIKHIDNVDKANYRKNLSLKELLIPMTREQLKKGKVDSKQIGDIISLVKEFDKKLREINSGSDDKKCQERKTLIENAYSELDDKIGKKSIRKATMHKILTLIANYYDEKDKKKQNASDLSGITIHLLNTLYRNHGKTLLNLFKKMIEK